MTGMLIALAVLTVVLYVALRRARIRDPFPPGFVFLTDTNRLVVSRYVPAGQMYVMPERTLIDHIEAIRFGVDLGPGDEVVIRATYRIGLEAMDPTRVVRLTGLA